MSPQRLLAVATASASMVVVASASGAQAAAADLPGAPALERSWTARVLYPIAARRVPGGRVIARLVHYTRWTQIPSSYMVTGSAVVRGKAWIRIQIPKRPNGTQAWIPKSAVDLRATTTWIRVSTSARTVSVFKAGKRVKRFRAAVGTGGTPTPRGLFAILDPVSVRGQLAPYVLVLTAHSNVLRTFAGGDGIVAIHGWPSSGVLGKAVSHGCIRMSRDGVRALARYARPGVPVEIIR